ncbi:MAG: tetratricopeptide repeat protein [Saprospiraceae bacterium]|nr:tetratricopeptide repeat protein [Saprospiraceae bacterium]
MEPLYITTTIFLSIFAAMSNNSTAKESLRQLIIPYFTGMIGDICHLSMVVSGNLKHCKPFFYRRQIWMTSLLFAGLILVFPSCKEQEKKEDLFKFATTGDEIIDALSLEIEKDPLNANLRYKRAERLYLRNKYDECIEDLRVAITTDSMQAPYYHLLADAFLDNNLSSRALQTMQKAAALFPTRIPTLLKLSEVQLILTQYDASILTLNEIVRIDAQNAEAYFMLGTTLNAMGEKKRAINAFQTATELDSKLTDAWISLGNLYAELKDKQAINFYQNAVNIDPMNANALHAMAYYLQNQGKENEAISLYRKIINANPGYTAAYLNSGILLMEKDSLDQALEQFNIMVGTDHKDWAG